MSWFPVGGVVAVLLFILACVVAYDRVVRREVKAAVDDTDAGLRRLGELAQEWRRRAEFAEAAMWRVETTACVPVKKLFRGSMATRRASPWRKRAARLQ